MTEHVQSAHVPRSFAPDLRSKDVPGRRFKWTTIDLELSSQPSHTFSFSPFRISFFTVFVCHSFPALSFQDLLANMQFLLADFP